MPKFRNNNIISSTIPFEKNTPDLNNFIPGSRAGQYCYVNLTCSLSALLPQMKVNNGAFQQATNNPLTCLQRNLTTKLSCWHAGVHFSTYNSVSIVYIIDL